MSMTRIAMREYIADLIGDNIASGTASSGSTAKLVDTDLYFEDDALALHWVFINAGAGITEERQIKSNGKDSHSIVPTKAFAATIDATSVYEIHEKFSVALYDRMINSAIRSARWFLLPKEDETVEMAADTFEYAIPTGFATIRELIYEGTAGDLDFEEIIPRRQWTIRPDVSEIQIIEDALRSGKKIRIIGQQRQAVLTTDAGTVDDRIADYIAHTAAAKLLLSAPIDPNDSEGHMKKIAFLAGEADRLKKEGPRVFSSSRPT